MTTWPLREEIPYTYRGTKAILKVKPGRVSNEHGVETYRVVGEIYGDRSDGDEPSRSFSQNAPLEDINEAAEAVVNRVKEEIDEQSDICEEATQTLREAVESTGGVITGNLNTG